MPSITLPNGMIIDNLSVQECMEIANLAVAPQIKLVKVRKSKENFENSNRPWTEDDKMQLLELFQKGYSAFRVGAIMGRTEAAVQREKQVLSQDYKAVDLEEPEINTGI